MTNKTTNYNNSFSEHSSSSFSPIKKKTGKFSAYAIGVLIVLLLCAISFTVAYVSATKANAASKVPNTVSVTYEVKNLFYTVETGDTISYIASQYIGDYPGTFIEYQDLICEENGIKNPNRIAEGDVLRIPVYTEYAVANN